MLQSEPYFIGRLREIVARPIPKSVKTEQLMNKAMSLFEKLVESDAEVLERAAQHPADEHE